MVQCVGNFAKDLGFQPQEQKGFKQKRHNLLCVCVCVCVSGEDHYGYSKENWGDITAMVTGWVTVVAGRWDAKQ